MIDTIKIVSMINYKTFRTISDFSNIKTSYNNETGQVFYKIINNSIDGAHNSHFSVRVGNGSKYQFTNMYYIEIEGSYHKFVKGYNSHNGFCNLQAIAIDLIAAAEKAYNIKLPSFSHWFLQRIDIAICFDLKSQENVKLYINNLSQCNFPRRNLKYYENESIYVAGNSTTLKIYNKLLEFLANDFDNFKNSNFDLLKYQDEIKGFIRYECEIKKRKLKHMYSNKYIRLNRVFYNDFKSVWTTEFQKLLKAIETDFELVRNQEKVKYRLETNFKKVRAKNLFTFYLRILIRGIAEVRNETDKSTYYNNLADLRKCGIDFSQKIGAEMNNNFLDFNPFETEEIK